MKKFMLLMFLVISSLSFSANAAIVDCPLKNLKKNQLRGADGTAFVPASAASSPSNSPKVSRGN